MFTHQFSSRSVSTSLNLWANVWKLTFWTWCVSELRPVKESTELVLNATTAINNLSYYQGDGCVVRVRHAHVSERKKRRSRWYTFFYSCVRFINHTLLNWACVCVVAVLLKLLLSSNMDAVLEATRVFGNLSQIQEVQRFIISYKGVYFTGTGFNMSPESYTCVCVCLCVSQCTGLSWLCWTRRTQTCAIRHVESSPTSLWIPRTEP